MAYQKRVQFAQVMNYRMWIDMGNERIKSALNPVRFPGMSGKMMAIVGYILETKWTTPALEEMVITSDGIIMARVTGDIGCNEILGSISDFKSNWDKLIHLPQLGLSEDEVKYLEVLPSCRIRNYGE
jgi:hypothetical protein